MDLETFIAETLRQILAGVKKAQHSTESLDAKINPYLPFGDYNSIVKNQIQKIEFDVAVTVTEGSEKKGGAGVAIAMFGVGGQATANTTNTSMSRIGFTVPVMLPKGTRIESE